MGLGEEGLGDVGEEEASFLPSFPEESERARLLPLSRPQTSRKAPRGERSSRDLGGGIFTKTSSLEALSAAHLCFGGPSEHSYLKTSLHLILELRKGTHHRVESPRAQGWVKLALRWPPGDLQVTLGG